MIATIPGFGAGQLRFGMKRSDVNNLIGPPSRRQRRDGGPTGTHADYDFYEALCMFVYYDSDDSCNGIEFGPDAAVTLDSMPVFATPARTLRAWIKERDADAETTFGCRSEKLGLALEAHFIDEPELTREEASAPPDSFLVFKPGTRPG